MLKKPSYPRTKPGTLPESSNSGLIGAVSPLIRRTFSLGVLDIPRATNQHRTLIEAKHLTPQIHPQKAIISIMLPFNRTVYPPRPPSTGPAYADDIRRKYRVAPQRLRIPKTMYAPPTPPTKERQKREKEARERKGNEEEMAYARYRYVGTDSSSTLSR